MTSLSAIAAGVTRCVSIAGDGPAVVRLKRLGICPGRCIEVLHAGDPMILRVVGARVGISRKLAGSVFVESPPDSSTHPVGGRGPA